MHTSRNVRYSRLGNLRCVLRFVAMAFSIVSLSLLGAEGGSGAASTRASILLPIDQVWKYDQSGLDLGSAWKERDYVDDEWPSGPGLFGLDTRPIAEPFPEPFRTPLNIYPPEDPRQILTYYFRTRFNFNGPTNNLVLVGGLLLDDGAVCYLNGVEVGRLRVPLGQTYSTLLTNEHQFFEGWYEPITFPADNLVEGDNVFAIEVHKSSYPGSSNLVFGLTLRAAWNEPPAILQQPIIVGGIQGAPTIITTTASGSALQYQWFKDSNPIGSATNLRYSITSTQPTNAGAYFVVASNAFGTATSSSVNLSVLPVTNPFTLLPPVLVSSEILLNFSQVLDPVSGTNTANYDVTILGTTNHLNFSTVQLSLNARSVRLRNVTPHDNQSNLLLNVHGVKNANGDVLNTQVIYWGTVTNNWIELIPLHADWRFWPDPLFEDLQGKWKGLDYDDSFWHGPAPAFLAGTNFLTSDKIDTRLPYVGPTYYFRTTFNMPDNFFPGGVTFSLSLAYKCGIVCYVNGTELARGVMPAGAVDFRTQASCCNCFPSSGGPISITRSTFAVTNLVPGTNVLAVEVHQPGVNIIPLWSGSSADLVFGAQVLANIQTRTLPPLSISRQGGTAVFSWPISTLALESARNPGDPWTPLTVNANSFALPIAAPMNYFRLRSW